MVDPVTFAICRWPVSRPASARARGLKGVRNVLWKNPENLTDKQRIKLAPRLPGAAPPGSVTTPPARACMKGSRWRRLGGTHRAAGWSPTDQGQTGRSPPGRRTDSCGIRRGQRCRRRPPVGQARGPGRACPCSVPSRAKVFARVNGGVVDLDCDTPCPGSRRGDGTPVPSLAVRPRRGAGRGDTARPASLRFRRRGPSPSAGRTPPA